MLHRSLGITLADDLGFLLRSPIGAGLVLGRNISKGLGCSPVSKFSPISCYHLILISIPRPSPGLKPVARHARAARAFGCHSALGAGDGAP